MHNMKKLILSVFIFTFGFATATHAQQVNTLLTKKLPEAPGKEIEVITVNYAPGGVDTINRMRIMPVDRVDASWGVIDSNDFNLFTRCFRKLFRKERIHLLGMRCRGKSEGKDKYREDELLHVMHRFCPFGDVLR